MLKTSKQWKHTMPVWLKYVKEYMVKICTQDENQWPQRSDLRCFYCCHVFEGEPVPSVTSYDEVKQTFHVAPFVFCSWSCAKAYSCNRVISRSAAINALYQACKGGHIGTLRTAPSRNALAVFGGEQDISQFRTNKASPEIIHLPSGVKAAVAAGSRWKLKVLNARTQQQLSVLPVIQEVPVLESKKQTATLVPSQSTQPAKKGTNYDIMSLIRKK